MVFGTLYPLTNQKKENYINQGFLMSQPRHPKPSPNLQYLFRIDFGDTGVDLRRTEGNQPIKQKLIV